MYCFVGENKHYYYYIFHYCTSVCNINIDLSDAL